MTQIMTPVLWRPPLVCRRAHHRRWLGAGSWLCGRWHPPSQLHQVQDSLCVGHFWVARAWPLKPACVGICSWAQHVRWDSPAPIIKYSNGPMPPMTTEIAAHATPPPPPSSPPPPIMQLEAPPVPKHPTHQLINGDGEPNSLRSRNRT